MVTAGAKTLAGTRAILKVCKKARRYARNVPHARPAQPAPNTPNIRITININPFRTGTLINITAHRANHHHSARVTQAHVTDIVAA